MYLWQDVFIEEILQRPGRGGGNGGGTHTSPNAEKWLGAHTYERGAIAKLDKLL